MSAARQSVSGPLARSPDRPFGMLALYLAAALAAACLVAMPADAQLSGAASPQAGPIDFATPDEAADALARAVRNGDLPRVRRMLGPGGGRLIHSGDPVADRAGRTKFIQAYDAAHRVLIGNDGGATLILGPEDWPLPIPIVRNSQGWHFDTPASAQKIIDRRVGRNELNVIEVCREFVSAQREYASVDRLGAGLHEYAGRFESGAGRHDGLYWDAAPGEPPSPLGPLMARARAEGYAKGPNEKGSNGKAPASLQPYHGYYFRILTRQGAHAPGGARDYKVKGHLTGGFALLAVPARWGDSGVMSFMVNQNGIVFEKNLGPDTARLARAIGSFDPDPGWNAR